MNFIVTIERKKPIRREPVSPMKILEGAQLKFKNAKRPPAKPKEIRANEVSSFKKNQIPKKSDAITPTEPANP